MVRGSPTATRRLLRAIREVTKNQSTYAKSELMSYDGRVHANFLPQGKEDDPHRKGTAASGRLASSEPNLQNQPRVARRMFIPSEGMVFIEADWAQAEVRVAAYASGDKQLIEDCWAPGGIHERIRAQLGCDRVRAKNTVFGTIYGGGAKTIVDLLRVHGITATVAEMRAIQDRLARAYPSLWAWRDEVMRDGKITGLTRNAFGRRRPWYWPSEQGPAMVNFIPQSTVGDCQWRVFKPLAEAINSLGGHLLAPVHDSILVEVPRADLYTASRALWDILTQEFPQVAPGFRLPIDLKWSTKSWGEMEPLPFERR